MELWEAVLVAVIGGASGVGGAFLASRITARESKADREEAAKARAEAREDARQQRFAEQRRQLLTDFWIECDGCMRAVEEHVNWRRMPFVGQDEGEWESRPDPWDGSTEPARRTFLALSLVNEKEVVSAASALFHATHTLVANHVIPFTPGRGHVDVDEEWRGRDLNAWMNASSHFTEAANQTLVGGPGHS